MLPKYINIGAFQSRKASIKCKLSDSAAQNGCFWDPQGVFWIIRKVSVVRKNFLVTHFWIVVAKTRLFEPFLV